MKQIRKLRKYKKILRIEYIHPRRFRTIRHLGFEPSTTGVKYKRSVPEDRFWNTMVTVTKFGGPTYTFLEHLSTDKIIKDVILLYTRLFDLGVEYQKGQVYLTELADVCGYDPP